MRPYATALAILVAALAALTPLTGSPARAGETPAQDSSRQQPAPRHPEAPQDSPADATAAGTAASPVLLSEAGGGSASRGDDAVNPAALEAMPADRALRDARNAEMEARRLTGEEDVARLAADLAKGLSHQEEVEIQRRIARTKEDAELDLFDIQAKYARLAGSEATAVEIEAMVKARRDAREGLATSASTPAQTVPAPARPKRGH